MRLVSVIFPTVQAHSFTRKQLSRVVRLCRGRARAVKADSGNTMPVTHSQEKAVMGH